MKPQQGHNPALLPDAVPAPCQRGKQRSYQFSMRGIVSHGKRSRFAIQGEDFFITKETWIIGTLHYGAAAHVQGVTHPGQGRYATKVTVQRSTGS